MEANYIHYNMINIFLCSNGRLSLLATAPRECLGLQGYCDCDFSVSPIPLELGWGLGA